MNSKMKSVFISKTGILLALAVAAVLVIAPKVKDKAAADVVNCPVISTTPVLNRYPVTTAFPRENCKDRPFLWAGLNNQYAYTINAQNGDEVEIRSYIHNSAADGSPAATNINVNFTVDTNAGSSHVVSASASSANAGSLGPSSITINTPAGSTLQVVSGSGQILDFYGQPDNGAGTISLTSSGASAHFSNMQACFQYSKFVVFKVKVVTQQQQIPSGTISATLGGQVPGQCLYSATIQWSTANVTDGGMFVVDPDTQQSKIVSGSKQGSTTVNWITPGKTYKFSVWTISWATSPVTKIAKLAETTLVAPSLNCGVTPPPVSSFNLTITPNPVCVGAKSTYTVSSATSDLNGKMIFWSSTLNGQSTGESLSGYNQFVSNGSWTGQSAQPWASSQIGTWVKTATIGNFSRSVTFQVKDCSVPVPTLSCVASPSTVNVNQAVTFTATGGRGSYSWSASGGSPSVGSGSNLVTSYSTSGTKTAAVTSGGQTANCSVQVSQVTPQSGLFLLTKEVRNVTQGTSFSHVATAKTGDTVEYQIKVSAGSSVILNNVRVTDTFAAGLSFINGSLTVNGNSSAPGLTNGGLVITQVSQTPTVIKYQATVTASSGSIINTAKATADNASNSPTDQALVNVTFVQPGQPTLAITKQVRNITKNSGYSTSVNAVKNDTVSYQITITNAGSAAATGVVLSDSNPIGISNLNVSKSYNGSLSGGITLGTLNAGETVTVTYNGTVNQDSGSIYNTATVSAENAATRTASAVVNITATPQNPGNNTVINNSYNNTCVNNSCNNTNTYYINYAQAQVPVSELRQLNVTKNVRNITSGYGGFANSATANNGDTVEFEIVVTNSGNQTVNNVRLNDTWTGGLNYISGTTRVDGSYSGDMWSNNTLYLGSLSAGQQKRITFQAQVSTGSGNSIQNTARASGDSVSTVQADAWVFVSGVQGGNVSLTYSKKAYNETKGADAAAVTASKEDFITYTLTVYNNGNTPAANFIITDDLSQVLPYADVVDNGGATVNGNVITYPALTIPAGGSVSKSFKVRIKFFLADNLSYVMNNTYGNTVTVRINTPQVKGAFIAPRTGANTGALAFGTLLTAGFALFRKRRLITKLIFT